MVNLLPKEQIKKLRSRYYSRLASSVFGIGALLVLISGALLTPSYFLALSTKEATVRYADALKETVSLQEKSGGGKVITQTAERVSILKKYLYPPVTKHLLHAITERVPKEVSVEKITFQDGGRGELTGFSKTRSALLAYADDLKKNSLLKNVMVPVSNFVDETDIAFTLSFSFEQGTP